MRLPLQLLSTTLLLTLLLFSCSATGKKQGNMVSSVETHFEIVDTTRLEAVGTNSYPMVEIPENIREPLQRGRYALEHFFDSWSEDAMERVLDDSAMEQGIVDYLFIYSSLPVEVVSQEDLLRPLKLMRGEALSQLLRLYTKYFYESSSPLKDHTLYLQVLHWATSSPQVEYVDQVIYKDMLSLVSQNQVGTLASDFAMTIAQPDTAGYIFADTTLHALCNKPKVIIFYTPGCDHCTHLLEEVTHDKILKTAWQEDKVQILYVSLVYDRKEWLEGLSDLPTFGTPSFNADLRLLDESLYDLAVTPVLYVISPDGKVLYREATLSEVNDFVSTL